MKRMNPKMTIELTLDDVNHINELIERDKAKPCVEHRLKTLDEIIYECPACEEALGINGASGIIFCRKCGQKVDTDNIGL